MPTFIDESGDTGPHDMGGKPYFRLAAVWVPTHDHAESFREAVRRLRRNLVLRDGYEFKFAETYAQPERRHAFLRTALEHDFRFAACSIDKTSDYWRSASGGEQHWACATALAAQLRPIYHRSEEEMGAPLREPVIVDNNSDADFLRTVKVAFRGLRSRVRPGSSLIGPVSFRRSGPDEMIHLADMVCGSFGALIDGEDKTWYRLIDSRRVGTICLP